MIIMDRRWTVATHHRRVVVKTTTLLFVKVVLLLSFTLFCASFGRARDDDDFVDNNDPFRANACLDAELYCEQTVRPAVEQDAKLREFLRDARKDAKTMNSWETIVPEDRFEALKTPETLAIGTRETKRLKRFFRRTPFCTTTS